MVALCKYSSKILKAKIFPIKNPFIIKIRNKLRIKTKQRKLKLFTAKFHYKRNHKNIDKPLNKIIIMDYKIITENNYKNIFKSNLGKASKKVN